MVLRSRDLAAKAGLAPERARVRVAWRSRPGTARYRRRQHGRDPRRGRSHAGDRARAARCRAGVLAERPARCNANGGRCNDLRGGAVTARRARWLREIVLTAGALSAGCVAPPKRAPTGSLAPTVAF